jgi:hypothetical protein
MTKLNLSEYVKTAEAAKVPGVSQNILRAWAEAGKISFRRNPANGIGCSCAATWKRSWRL